MNRVSAAYVRADQVLESMDGALEPFEAEESDVLEDLINKSLGKYFEWAGIDIESVGGREFNVNFQSITPRPEIQDLVNLIGIDLIMDKVTSYFFNVHGYTLNLWF